MPDIKKIARVIRLQEMANSLGVPLLMDQVETQILTQRKDARGDRSARGGLGIMKDINDPFYAYTAARGDLTPSALEFIEKVATRDGYIMVYVDDLLVLGDKTAVDSSFPPEAGPTQAHRLPRTWQTTTISWKKHRPLRQLQPWTKGLLHRQHD